MGIRRHQALALGLARGGHGQSQQKRGHQKQCNHRGDKAPQPGENSSNSGSTYFGHNNMICYHHTAVKGMRHTYRFSTEAHSTRVSLSEFAFSL